MGGQGGEEELAFDGRLTTIVRPTDEGEGMRLELRPAQKEDEPFLHELLIGSISEQLAAWAWEESMRGPLLEMQYQAREQGWRGQYPEAEHRIILAGGRPVGRMLVARGESEIRLVDIVVDPAHRKTGIGTRLILELIEESEATGKPIRLSVALTNPAERLYRRLGFEPIGNDGLVEQMERMAGARA